VIPGEYILHIGGYQEKVEDSYIGYDDDILVLTVLPAALSAPVLVSPVHAELDTVPGLVWTPVPGAKGYMWEIATSNTVDETGLFTDVVCSGSTTTESAVIPCDLQKDITYYWHVWAFTDTEQGPPSEVSTFVLREMNHDPVILSASVFPETGDTGTVFTYTAVYQDEDNDPPVITIYIDGLSHTMVAVDLNDTNYADGKEYQYMTTLSKGEHEYFIVCDDGKGGSYRYPDTGTVKGPLVLEALSAPVLVSPLNNAEVGTVPLLEWTPVPGAKGYTWEIATSDTVDEAGLFTDVVCSGSTTTESVAIPCDLQKNIWYYWHVWAFTDTEQGPPSQVYTFTVCGLSSPVLNSPAYGALTVGLRPLFSWNPVNGAVTYTVQVSTDSSFAHVVVNETINATSYVPSFDLIPATEYYWRVKAESKSCTSEWATNYFVTEAATSFGVPTLLYPDDNAINIELRPIFSWNPVEGAAAYVLQVSTSSSFSHFTINERITATSYMTSFDLEPDNQYYWRVKAETQNGPGNWSEPRQFTTATLELPPLLAPIVATPDGEKGEGHLILSWNAVPDADSYHVQISKIKTFPENALEIIHGKTTVTVTSTSIDITLPPDIYYWRVRAESSDRYSDWSKGDHYFEIIKESWLPTLVFNPIVQGMVVISAALTIIYVLIPIIRRKK
jgi:hypothetical protein